MGPTDWFTGKDGELIAASGIRMTPRDLARIGQLMLRGGVWDDRVVVPAEWIARCTMPVVPIDEVRDYGYHWYLGRIGFETPRAALEQVAAGALLERRRQWRPAPVCVSRAGPAGWR